MYDTNCIPRTVFVCGAVGSGNTFMFNCLTRDKHVFGVNEDALGSTLHRLIRSEKEMGKCPHSLDAFADFIRDLRGGRRTLVLKTPSNLRYAKLILKHLPESHFITMIREPHGAITSGIDRHAAGASIELNATRWRNDVRDLKSLNESSTVVTFEEFSRNPTSVLDRISREIMPLSEAVYIYAKRMHRPERADEERWKGRVDTSTREEIIHWVREMNLVDLYLSVAQAREQSARANEQGVVYPQGSGLIRSKLDLLRKHFHRIRYRFFK